jgi:hypothetical protein
MSNRVNITITSDLAEGTLAESFSDTSKNKSLAKMVSFLRGMMGGQHAASITTSVNEGTGAYATKTVTLTDCIAEDQLVVNGVIFEAGTDWQLGADDAADAVNLAAAINASTNALVEDIVSAEAESNTVIITAREKGAAGNSITLQAIGSDGIDIPGAGTAATSDLTCTSVAASDTAVINGTTLTAVDKKEKTQVTCVADQGEFEQTTITCVADTGAFEEVTVNVPSTAAAAQGDYFVLENPAGATAAFWIDIDDNGTEPTGAAYVASDSKIRIDTTTGNTAAQNATILQAAAATILNWTAVDNLDGTVTYTQTLVGNTTNAAKHNTGDTGDGSFTFSAESNGAASNLNDTYFTFSNANDAVDYYVWYNVNGEGTDPEVASTTGIEVAIAAGATDSAVASATRSALAAAADVTITGATNQAIITNDLMGPSTDTADTGSTGFTINKDNDGVASNLLDSYFTFSSSGDATDYYIWYNVNGEGTDPAVADTTGIEVAIDAAETANDVAAATRAKFLLAPLSADFTESGATDKVLFRNKTIGATTNAADGAAATGFTISVTVAGGTVGASEFQIGDTNAATATALGALINSHSSLDELVIAEVADDVVTVTASEDGVEGNSITLVGTGGIAAGDTRLAGGTDENFARLTGGSGSTVTNEVTLNFGV